MHNKHYLGMNEGMNQSSMRCFDDSLTVLKSMIEPTVQTVLVSLARYVDISFFKVGEKNCLMKERIRFGFVGCCCCCCW
jgi:hypothetical protein